MSKRVAGKKGLRKWSNVTLPVNEWGMLERATGKDHLHVVVGKLSQHDSTRLTFLRNMVSSQFVARSAVKLERVQSA